MPISLVLSALFCFTYHCNGLLAAMAAGLLSVLMTARILDSLMSRVAHLLLFLKQVVFLSFEWQLQA